MEISLYVCNVHMTFSSCYSFDMNIVEIHIVMKIMVHPQGKDHSGLPWHDQTCLGGTLHPGKEHYLL